MVLRYFSQAIIMLTVKCLVDISRVHEVCKSTNITSGASSCIKQQSTCGSDFLRHTWDLGSTDYMVISMHLEANPGEFGWEHEVSRRCSKMSTCLGSKLSHRVLSLPLYNWHPRSISVFSGTQAEDVTYILSRNVFKGTRWIPITQHPITVDLMKAEMFKWSTKEKGRHTYTQNYQM